ncbi:hypothetical protein GCM10011386_02590 [Parapedobacter defluvii]|uniref:Uncharacterized protein n=1 Tax=Parapedobacter defluvii TaxID=2045106 RepID=A0ABQ1KY75_9SPHI|nr:hypothetical protein GCM10011386_02590 [Parapedobacter defluvii]
MIKAVGHNHSDTDPLIQRGCPSLLGVTYEVKTISQNTSTSYEADDPEGSPDIPFPDLLC